jgi:Na+/H+ antiporter NhaD/arsenite permease-like protein
MTLDFMEGATIFALINLISFLLIAFFMVRGAKKIYAAHKEHGTLIFPSDAFYLGAIVLIVIFFGSLAQPKLTIDTPTNRVLQDYMETNPEIVIETPPPRTETMEGFSPLKVDQ